MIVLGIESSCDDTAVALINGKDNTILSNVVVSQNEQHKLFKGVVPEIASRAHLENFDFVLNEALKKAGKTLEEISLVAATAGPGLIGGLIVGMMSAKTIASVYKKPFVAVNHLEGHALVAQLTDKVKTPYLLLLVSGGHCQFIAVLGNRRYKILGTTLDDAVGEAFDKVAKMLDLPFPGGPNIEKKAKKGDAFRFNFPRPLIDKKNCDMSFSGLKTAVRLKIEEIKELNEQDISDVAASFQRSVCEVLSAKVSYAASEYEKLVSVEDGKRFVISGGVASNLELKEKLSQVLHEIGYSFVAPPINLCTDNAVMIAFAGLTKFNSGIISNMDFKPRARWSIEEL